MTCGILDRDVKTRKRRRAFHITLAAADALELDRWAKGGQRRQKDVAETIGIPKTHCQSFAKDPDPYSGAFCAEPRMASSRRFVGFWEGL